MKTLEDQNISKRQRKTTITIDNVNTVNTFFHVFFWQPESGEKVDALPGLPGPRGLIRQASDPGNF